MIFYNVVHSIFLGYTGQSHEYSPISLEPSAEKV